MTPSTDNHSYLNLIAPAVAVLADIPLTAREWALAFVNQQLLKIQDHRDLIQITAPAACLFYTRMNQPDQVKAWLDRVSQKEAPIWKDRALGVMAEWFVSEKQFDRARDMLNQMATPDVKDAVRQQLAEALAVEQPVEAGEIMAAIRDATRQAVVAGRLKDIPEFTAERVNVYHLLLALEHDPESLADLMVTLVRRHPQSDVVRALADMFAPARRNDGNLLELVQDFLTDEPVKNCIKPKKLAVFAEELAADSEKLKDMLKTGLVQMLVAEGLIDSDEAQDIRRQTGMKGMP